MTERLILTLAILGGTGNEGQGLAYRWAKAGYHVVIGSRTPPKAEGVAEELNERLGSEMVRGAGNEEAAADCDIAVLTVPYKAHRSTLEGLKDPLQGKILVDVTVPLNPDDITAVHVPDAGSAAQEAQSILGEDVQVIAAFQNVSHVHLQEDGPVPCDVLVCGDSEPAKQQVLQLVDAAGLAGWNAGPLRNAVVVEGLTPILLGINRRHETKHAGIRITGG
ncbi:MAG: NADPH-dependent F420 reductase [Anaerolineales bacterium]|nr:NADPH-dependent F420 reductase [Anaerolineales bacterium]